jgi:hypothetical protein
LLEEKQNKISRETDKIKGHEEILG